MNRHRILIEHPFDYFRNAPPTPRFLSKTNLSLRRVRGGRSEPKLGAFTTVASRAPGDPGRTRRGMGPAKNVKDSPTRVQRSRRICRRK
jgi:hypothetical protein